MSNELLKTLEEKVQTAVEKIDQLRQENNKLKAQNQSLIEDKARWEEKLTELIGKFERMVNESTAEQS